MKKPIRDLIIRISIYLILLISVFYSFYSPYLYVLNDSCVIAVKLNDDYISNKELFRRDFLKRNGFASIDNTLYSKIKRYGNQSYDNNIKDVFYSRVGQQFKTEIPFQKISVDSLVYIQSSFLARNLHSSIVEFDSDVSQAVSGCKSNESLKVLSPYTLDQQSIPSGIDVSPYYQECPSCHIEPSAPEPKSIFQKLFHFFLKSKTR